ncbi:MAG: S8 family serine peptidase [Streptosporangiales bacterium]|nr:S8 family serine peptidase [Streptosporangiales bacterium]
MPPFALAVRRLVAAVAAAAMLLAAQAAPAAAAPPATPDPAATAAATPVRITLVTGDIVTLRPGTHGRPDVLFEPRHGTDGRGGFRVRREGDSTYVVPSDVSALVPAVLDRALFDVTGLAAMGYDDARRTDMPLIVERTAGTRTLAAAPEELRTRRTLDSIDATAAVVDKAGAAGFGDDLARLSRRGAPDRAGAARALGGVDRIWLDARVEAAELDGYLGLVDAPAAWDSGLDGAGVTVAVLDTGIDGGHPDLANQVRESSDFTGTGPGADDRHGHGTHVASLLAGTGARSDGARRGIAFGAELLAGKVLDDTGTGQASWVIAGMQWAVRQGADVVNLSLGGTAGDTDDPTSQAVDALTASSDTLFVVAAGNQGGLGVDHFTVDTPGTAASALTVGAVRTDDFLAVFSGEGPVRGSYRLKPDITAPGVDLLGARAGARDGDFYRSMSGTSQATPVVAGAAALLRQQHPDWTWQQVKSTLVTSAHDHANATAWSEGGGRLDLRRAVTQTLHSDLSAIDFGQLKHPDDDVRTRTLTLTNDAAEPVDVTLTDTLDDGYGTSAAEAALTVSPATLTVPAGGSASTTITFEPTLADDGLLQGMIDVATTNGDGLHLPVNAHDEPERYDLTVKVLDRAGKPYANGVVNLVNATDLRGTFFDVRLDERGEATVHTAPARFSAFSRVTTPAGGGAPETFTIAGSAEFTVDRDTTFVVDARDAQRVRPPTVHDQATRVAQASVAYSRYDDGRRGAIEYDFFDPADIAAGTVFISPTRPVRQGIFQSAFQWRLEPTGHRSPTTPDAYELVVITPTFGPSPHLDRHDVARLARVDNRYAGIDGRRTLTAGRVFVTDLSGVGLVHRRPVDVPTRSVELVTPAPNLRWTQCLAVPAVPVAELCDPDWVVHERGERRTVDWGRGLHVDAAFATHSTGIFSAGAGLADGTHHGRFPGTTETQQVRLYRNGTLVGSRDQNDASASVPPEPAEFRMEHRYTMPADTLPVATSGSTAWTFRSSPPAPQQGGQTVPPLLRLRYDPLVDDLGRARAHRPLPITVTVGHLARATGEVPRPTAARLAYSTDGGETWHALRTTRIGMSRWVAVVPGVGRTFRSRVVAAGHGDRQRGRHDRADGDRGDPGAVTRAAAATRPRTAPRPSPAGGASGSPPR